MSTGECLRLGPRKSAEFIAKNAVDVKISEENVIKLAAKLEESIPTKKFSLSSWKDHDVNPKTADAAAIDWIFFVDSLNFSFWIEESEPRFAVTYKENIYSGYFSLCACVQRALAEGISLIDPNYYSSMTIEELRHVFRSDGDVEMPLLPERLKVLHENGHILLQKFDGSFKKCIEQCGKSAQTLVDIVIQNFPSFNDVATYSGKQVSFYKRAQILIADIWACFEGNDDGQFYDIDTITMFADYRVPQALAYFGILQYSVNLLSRLKEDDLMMNQERQEVELRGCSVHAVELLVSELRKSSVKSNDDGVVINSILVDFFLWNYRLEHADKVNTIPFHKVRCIFY